MTVSLKLGGVGAGGGSGGGVEVAKLDEAFISNVPVSADTPSLLQEAEPRCHTPSTPPSPSHTHTYIHYSCTQPSEVVDYIWLPRGGENGFNLVWWIFTRNIVFVGAGR